MAINPIKRGGPDIPVADGGTGASTGNAALTNLGGLSTAIHATTDHTGLPGVASGFTPSYFFGVADGLPSFNNQKRITYNTNVLKTGDITHSLVDGSFTFANSGVYTMSCQHSFSNNFGANGTVQASLFIPAGQDQPGSSGAVSASRRFGTATDYDCHAHVAIVQITAGNPALDNFDLIVHGDGPPNFIYDIAGATAPFSAITIVRIA